MRVSNLDYSLPQRARHYFRRLSFQIMHPLHYAGLQQQRTRQNVEGRGCGPFDEHKCIYIHIPKCAGSSVCESLFGNRGGGHKTLKRFQILYGPKEFQEYFKFTIVRNPWDRMVSAFHFLKKGGLNMSNKKWGEENLSRFDDFDAFVRKWVNRKNIHLQHHFRPQCEFICLEAGKPHMDFIGYYENLEADFARICERLQIKAGLQELNRNRSRKKDYRSYYTGETRRIVAEAYADDIGMLGYDFDNSTLPRVLAQRDRNGR